MTTRHGKVLGYRRTRPAWGDGLEGFGMRQKMVRVAKGFMEGARPFLGADRGPTANVIRAGRVCLNWEAGAKDVLTTSCNKHSKDRRISFHSMLAWQSIFLTRLGVTRRFDMRRTNPRPAKDIHLRQLTSGIRSWRS